MSDPPTPSSQWEPPKNPVPPHRLARLANALGVPTPIIHAPPSPSYAGSNPVHDQYRRSPTPSTATSFAFASSSKYLLHVIPPMNLPHDSDAFDSDLTPPSLHRLGLPRPLSARNPRSLPLNPPIPTRRHRKGPSATENPKSLPEEDEVPGPRLSDDIWRHLWVRVAKSESREEGLSPPLLGLGLGIAGRSSPYLHQSSAYPLPLISRNGTSNLQAPLHPQPQYPVTPSPTTPSSTSEIPRYNTKSAPPSTSSRSASDADGDADRRDAETPATSRADSLDLPGLGTDALIPILAKVEFDIDRRRAAWFEPWLRSRRMNHAKHTRSTSTAGAGSSADDEERRAPLPFKLNGNRTGSPESLAAARALYLPLSESPSPMLGSEADDDDSDARLAPRPGNPQGDLDDDGDEDDEDEDLTRRRDAMGRSRLTIEANGMSSRSSPSRKKGPPTPLILHPRPGSDPTNVPPLAPDSEADTPPSEEEEGRTILPYLDPERDLDPEQRSKKTPAKRGGGFYDDMDLGFSSDDLEDDPNDRRKSQFLMRAQLDEIEKNLAQFSPRKLKSETLEEDQTLHLNTLASSPTLSPPKFSPQSAISPSEVFQALSNSDVFPPTPRLPQHPNALPDDESDLNDPTNQAAWPAVPFNTLAERTNANERSPPRLAVNGVSTSAPKRFLPNSRAPGAPGAPSETELRKKELEEQQTSYPAMTPAIGKKTSLNSPLIPLSPDPFGRYPSQQQEQAAGPNAKRQSGAYWEAPVVIPAAAEPPAASGVNRKSSEKSLSDKSSSRFSTDSLNGAPDAAAKAANRTTIMSVKNIKKLWRKSHSKSSASITSVNTAVTRRISTVPENAHSPLTPPARPNRPSMEEMYFPDVDVPVPRTPLTPGFGQASSLNAPPSPNPGAARRPSPRPSIDMPPPPPPMPQRRPSESSLASSQAPSPIPPPMQRRPSQGSDHSQHVVGTERRPSQDEIRMQHQAAVPVLPSPTPPPIQMMPPRMAPPMGMGMNRPPPMLQSSNSAPIMAAKAGPPRRMNGDGLTWDQESPYPTRMMQPPTPQAQHPGFGSIPSRPTSAQSMQMPPPPPPAPSTSPPPPMPSSPPMPAASLLAEKDKTRKSILKWKAAANGLTTNNLPMNGGLGGAVPAPLTPSATSYRARRPSWSSTAVPTVTSPSQGSPMVLPPDIPPSPKLPEQFIASNGFASGAVPPNQPSRSRPNSAAIMQRRLSAKMASSGSSISAGSGGGGSGRRHNRAQGSMASSSYSRASGSDEGTLERSSLDTSGFEIVSPRMGGTLSFPYTEVTAGER
ncbi:hypothetical protein MKEN_01262100 [Mycena kentingensis (nom. inval.)]|nr:hypothetical protein MKEN_01262100 [Mycena kentingensis (nom. inval.)]